MKLARSTLINTLTKIISRSAEAANINVAVAANGIIAAFKQQTVIRPCCTSAQEDSLKDRSRNARRFGYFSRPKRRLGKLVERWSHASGKPLHVVNRLARAMKQDRASPERRGDAQVSRINQPTFCGLSGRYAALWRANIRALQVKDRR